jgi:hypothetical protein
VDQFQADLKSLQHRPSEVTRLMRIEHLVLLGILWPLGAALLVALLMPVPQALGLSVASWEIPLCMMGACVIWSFLTRGGISYPIQKWVLVTADGRKASRVRCAWRTVLFWTPVAALIGMVYWVDAFYPAMGWLKVGLVCSIIALFLAYPGLAIWFPARSPHDRLAGTYLVPR